MMTYKVAITLRVMERRVAAFYKSIVNTTCPRPSRGEVVK